MISDTHGWASVYHYSVSSSCNATADGGAPVAIGSCADRSGSVDLYTCLDGVPYVTSCSASECYSISITKCGPSAEVQPLDEGNCQSRTSTSGNGSTKFTCMGPIRKESWGTPTIKFIEAAKVNIEWTSPQSRVPLSGFRVAVRMSTEDTW